MKGAGSDIIFDDSDYNAYKAIKSDVALTGATPSCVPTEPLSECFAGKMTYLIRATENLNFKQLEIR